MKTCMPHRGAAVALVAMVLLSGCAASPAAPTASVAPATDRVPPESSPEAPRPAATALAPEETLPAEQIQTPEIEPASAPPTEAGFDPSTARWAPVHAGPAGPAGGDMVGFDNGYVALGSADFEEPIVWFSSDGVAWETRSLADPVPNCPGWGPDGDEDVPDADAGAIATNGYQVIVAGSWHPHDAAACAGLGYWPITWVTDDGLTWRRSKPFFADTRRGRATAVWAVQDGWQAVVDDSLWQSPDGLRWRAAGVLRGVVAVNATGTAPDGTVVVSRFVGAAGSGPARLFASGDGGTWTKIEEAGGCETGATQIVAPSTPGLDAWVVLADTRICTSPDLVHWSTKELPMAVWRIARTRFGAIAIGDTCHGAGTNCPDPGPRAYITADGVAWSRLRHPKAYWGRSLADGPAGVLLIGAAPHDDDAQAWRLNP
jgi:hypothetical protein